MSRVGVPVALARIWPGRSDRLIIAPHDLRTADATRAAEVYAGRFVFAGKIVTCHSRSIFDLEPPSDDWDAALLGFGWPFWLGMAVAVSFAIYHYFLIRGRERMPCFAAFRHNNWLGAAVFAGIAGHYLLTAQG